MRTRISLDEHINDSHTHMLRLTRLTHPYHQTNTSTWLYAHTHIIRRTHQWLTLSYPHTNTSTWLGARFVRHRPRVGQIIEWLVAWLGLRGCMTRCTHCNSHTHTHLNTHCSRFVIVTKTLKQSKHFHYWLWFIWLFMSRRFVMRVGELGSRPKKMYGERLGDRVEYHLMSPTPRR